MIRGMFYVDGGIESDFSQHIYLQGVFEALFKIGKKDITSVKFISALNGDSHAYSLCEAYRKDEEPNFIVTNNSLLFSFHKFIWDHEKGVFNLWMWKDDDNMEVGEFVHINELTERELMEYHNIYKMWRNGALDIWRSWENDPET